MYRVKRFFKETKIVALFLVLLTAVTIFSYVDVVAETRVSSLDNIRTDIIKVNPRLVRAPANAGQVESLSLTKDFFCGSALSSEKVSQHMVMINFKLCDSEKKFEDVSFVNESNGFKAQIFKLEDGNYKTDYIQLNKGTNKLNIEVILKDGQKRIESLEIVSGS